MEVYTTEKSGIGYSVKPYSDQHKLVLYIIRALHHKDRLISFSEKGHGFGCNNSMMGLTYPNDLDDNDKDDGCFIEGGYVEIYSQHDEWEFHIPEVEYLEILRQFYLLENLGEYASRTEGLIARRQLR